MNLRPVSYRLSRCWRRHAPERQEKGSATENTPQLSPVAIVVAGGDEAFMIMQERGQSAPQWEHFLTSAISTATVAGPGLVSFRVCTSFVSYQIFADGSMTWR